MTVVLLGTVVMVVIALGVAVTLVVSVVVALIATLLQRERAGGLTRPPLRHTGEARLRLDARLRVHANRDLILRCSDLLARILKPPDVRCVRGIFPHGRGMCTAIHDALQTFNVRDFVSGNGL